MDPTIVCKDLTKVYGSRRVVDDVSFQVPAGSVTALVGRNGSGKSTTLRMLLGLTAPTAGTALINGVPYRDLPAPARVVGAATTDVPGHPALTVRAQLRLVARSLGMPITAADDVLETVDLTDAAHRKISALSLGMRQRLSLGCALIGSPGALVLDEPANGLDPDGIRWLRAFLRGFADDGGAVLVSSHSLDEIEKTADDVVVLSHRVRYAGTVSALMAHEHQASLEDAFHSVLDREAAAV
ncbi:ABC transporter ATP-binding protein [Streptomyces flavofungini]|uniref:ABC transporter ATP-binding protein n=1 Tax=Streptomyces flavofungini TaxID=68200 RepID=UPI0025AFA06D|nr:ATP-binding cassette domain-containing protein [Streptomyces flavofungini]WJV47442.1 ATP-binding cassette domain-containing protein [Streptomyces flavofungini]